MCIRHVCAAGFRRGPGGARAAVVRPPRGVARAVGGYKPHILHTCIYGTSRHGTPPPRDPPAGVGLGLALFWGGEIQKKEELE